MTGFNGESNKDWVVIVTTKKVTEGSESYVKYMEEDEDKAAAKWKVYKWSKTKLNEFLNFCSQT
jgi:hypoxanthine phosphoribosyltransferase